MKKILITEKVIENYLNKYNREKKNFMFDNFISLGWKCKVAASIEKYGLRSCSGPFDWCVTEFKGVIETIDSNFSEFLSKENLSILSDPKKFKNTKYGIEFSHDIINNFDEDYEEIYLKYMRRIKRFYNNIKNKTCFIRAVANQNEITYIIENLEYINYVIKKQNPNNEIVYLVEDSISVSSCIGHYYRIKNVDIIKYKNVDDLRNLFDTSYEFIDFCKNNFDESLRYHNLVYYLENRLKRMENELDMSTSNYQVLSNLESTDFQTINLPNNVIIYGAGNIGRILYNKIKCKCSVKYFIDENIDKKTYDMVPIIKVKELVDIHNIDVIIVTPIYDYNRICFNIHEIINDKVDIVSLKEFL